MSVFDNGHVHLNSATVMMAALAELVGDNAAQFRGTVSSWPEQNPPGPARWAIEVNDWKGTQTRAVLGDHLVLTYGYLLRVSDEDYQAQQGS